MLASPDSTQPQRVRMRSQASASRHADANRAIRVAPESRAITAQHRAAEKRPPDKTRDMPAGVRDVPINSPQIAGALVR